MKERSKDNKAEHERQSTDDNHFSHDDGEVRQDTHTEHTEGTEEWSILAENIEDEYAHDAEEDDEIHSRKYFKEESEKPYLLTYLCLGIGIESHTISSVRLSNKGYIFDRTSVSDNTKWSRKCLSDLRE